MTVTIAMMSGWPMLGALAVAFGGCALALTISIIRLYAAWREIVDLQSSKAIIEDTKASMLVQLDKLTAMQSDIVRKARIGQLDQLIATVAHELRNPIGAVRISSFMLKRKLPDLRPDCAALFERIEIGIERCDSIITQLLDYSSQSNLNLAVDDLHAWMSHLLEEQAPKLPQDISLRLVIGEGPLEASFDHLRMRRAVINLINNAVDALSSRANAVIEIEVLGLKGHVSIEVRDNGPGIPAEIMEKVSEPLFTTKSFGAGLGLASSRKVAELHGGALELSSDHNGARVRIWFPKAQAESLAA